MNIVHKRWVRITIAVLIAAIIFGLGSLTGDDSAKKLADTQKEMRYIRSQKDTVEADLSVTNEQLNQAREDLADKPDLSVCQTAVDQSVQLAYDYNDIIVQIGTALSNGEGYDQVIANTQSVTSRLAPIIGPAKACDPNIGDKLQLKDY